MKKVGFNNWGSFYLSWIIAFEWNIRCLRCDIIDSETRLSTMYAIRLYSKDNDDLRRGTDNDDEMKMYEKYRCKVNMWENSFDGNCIRLGCRIEAEFVPRPSLYSPINDNEYNYHFQHELCNNFYPCIFIYWTYSLLTSKYMHIYWNRFSYCRWTCIYSCIWGSGKLNHQETRRYISFLCDNTYTTTRGVVRYYLQI